MTQIIRVRAELGPTSGVLPTSDAGWVAWPEASVIEDATGHANDVGSAAIRVQHGLRILPGASAGEGALSSPPAVLGAGTISDPYRLAIMGRYVRLLYSADEGATWVAYWWGTVNSCQYVPRGSAEFELQVDCIGILATLEKTIHLQGPEKGIDASGGAGLIWTQAATEPNGHEGGAGDRSAGTFVVGGNAIYAADRLLSGAQKQRAKDVLLQLLVEGESLQSSLEFDADGQLDALNYSDQWDLYNLTLREAIARVINPRYGVTYYVSVTPDGIPTLNINSILENAVSSVGVTLPATNRVYNFDAATNIDLSCERFTEDDSATADIIIMESAPAWHVITVSYETAAAAPLLNKGWDSTDETAWSAATDGERETGKLSAVWRRFVFAQSWRGGDTTNRARVWETARAVSGTTDPLHGYQGITGAFTADATSPLYLPNGRRTKMSRMLPLFEGVNWADTGTTTWDRNAPRLRPMFFVVDGANVWTTIGDYLGREMSVTCDDIDGSILLGTGAEDAQAIADIINEGNKLVFTIAVQHPYSTRVSWNRDPALRPRVAPRLMARTFPQLEKWILRGTAVLGVNAAGAPISRGADLTVLDPLPILLDHLAMAKTYYSEPAIKASFHYVGMDFSTVTAPGAFVGYAVLPFGEFTGNFAVKNVITRRGHKWTDDGSYGTYYSTERILPDLDMLK